MPGVIRDSRLLMAVAHIKAEEYAAGALEQSWGRLQWLAGSHLDNAEGLTLGRVLIWRGHSNPRHCHPSCEEVLYLLAGRLEHTLGSGTFVLEPGDSLAIPAGVFHNATSIGDVDADMMVAYSTGTRDYVAEPVQPVAP